MDKPALLMCSDKIWKGLTREDWTEAFASHPRLGESHATSATDASLDWSRREQSRAIPNQELSDANARYEQHFGHIFLVCANGLTTTEILAELERRMYNNAEREWQEAGEQQRQITQLRLQQWLVETQP